MSGWPINAWYVAAWDHEVDSRPFARTICGVPLMLYRKLDRGVVVLRDTCPHRLLPLSMGLREGDSIRCRYHGLKLGPDGVAEEMPNVGELPNKGICAEVFAVVERHRFVWVWVGDRSAADPALIPDPPPFWRGGLKREGRVDRWQICEFLMPSCVIIDVGVAPVGAGATIADHDQGVRGFMIDAMTPESEGTMHYFWGMARNFDIDDAGFSARFRKQQGGVFLEDVEVLEAQQRSIMANPDMRLNAYSIDSGGVRAGAIIERAIRRATPSAQGTSS